jgi:hypothetical protein
VSTKRLITLDKKADPRSRDKVAFIGGIKNVLFGRGFENLDDETRKYVSRNVFSTGSQRSDDIARQLLENTVTQAKAMGPSKWTDIQRKAVEHGDKFLSWARANPLDMNDRGLIGNMLLGRKDAGDVTKSRFLQGGIFGKGGLIQGDILPPDHFIEASNKYLKDVVGGTSMGLSDHLKGGFQTLGTYVAPAVQAYNSYLKPGYLAYKALTGGAETRGSDFGRLAGRITSNALLNQYGMLPSMIGGTILENVGGMIGSVFNKKPQIPQIDYSGPLQNTMQQQAGNIPYRMPFSYQGPRGITPGGYYGGYDPMNQVPVPGQYY